MRFFLILALFLPCLALAQQETVPSEDMPYAAVFLQEGLPEFRPLRDQIRKEGHTVTIPLADSAHTVSFVWGKGKDGESVYWIMHRRPDSTVSLVSPSMQPDKFGTLSASVVLRLDPESGAATPLRLRLLPLHKALLYRWTGSSPQAPGGVPTAESSALRMGKAAPDFAVQVLDGWSIRLSDFERSLVVINSWATHCAPCIEEIPGLNKLVEKYGSKDVVFLAIARDTEEDLRSFLERREFHYQHALASEATTAIFGDAFPRNVIISPGGTTVYDCTGGSADTYRELDDVIAALTGAK